MAVNETFSFQECWLISVRPSSITLFSPVSLSNTTSTRFAIIKIMLKVFQFITSQRISLNSSEEKRNFQHFIAMCPGLHHMIEKFVKLCKERNFLEANFNAEMYMVTTEEEIDEGQVLFHSYFKKWKWGWSQKFLFSSFISLRNYEKKKARIFFFT